MKDGRGLLKYLTYDKNIHLGKKKLTIVYENSIGFWISGRIVLSKRSINFFLRNFCNGTTVNFGKYAEIKAFAKLVTSILQIVKYV